MSQTNLSRGKKKINNLFSENSDVYKRTWKSLAEPDRPQMTIPYNTERAFCTLEN